MSEEKWFPITTIQITDLNEDQIIDADLFYQFECPSCHQILKNGAELVCPEKGELISFECENCEKAYDLIHRTSFWSE